MRATKTTLVRRWSLVATLALASSLFAKAQTYDLLLKGGHVVDPLNNFSAVGDLAVRGGPVAALARA